MVTKKALVVGCNYRSAIGIAELNGCCNDAMRMLEVMMSYYGFEKANIDILVDDPSDGGSYEMPTNANIRAYLGNLIDGAESGDILVFHFSGHGGNKDVAKGGRDETGMDELICPSDHWNVLTDEDFRDFVSKIPEGMNFTFIADSCCSGGFIDEMKAQVGGKEQTEGLGSHIEVWQACSGQCSKRYTKRMLISSLNDDEHITDPVDNSNLCTVLYNLFGDEASPAIKRKCEGTKSDAACKCKCDDVGILLSGCEFWEFTQDDGDADPPQGTFTTAIEAVLKELRGLGQSSPTNRDLIMFTRSKIAEGFEPSKDQSEPQHPCLYCSDRNADGIFICDFVEVKS